MAFKLNYASREFMLSKLEPMGLTGSAAAVSRNVAQLPDYDDGHRTVDYANVLHRGKHQSDQRTQSHVQDSLTQAQTTLFNGGKAVHDPRVVAENPFDMWVDPRAHYYRGTQEVVCDRELVRANEPWRIYSDAKLSSIKHQDTR